MTGQYKIYLIAFNASDVNLPLFENFLRRDSAILGFWNNLPLVYLVKSNLSTPDLATRIRAHMAGRQCLVAEINAMNVDGWLPQPAWEWFRAPPDRQMPLGLGAPYPPQNAPGLGGLFAPEPPKQPGLLGGLFGIDPNRK